MARASRWLNSAELKSRGARVPSGVLERRKMVRMPTLGLRFLSLHPTRDVVLRAFEFELGQVQRAESWFSYPGGKALNAARTSGLLGGSPLAVVLAPAGWRPLLRKFLHAFRVRFQLLPVEGEGRLCIALNEARRETVINTDLKLALPLSTRIALGKAIRRAALRPGFLVFAGSLPPTLGTQTVRTFVRLASLGRARVALDQSGRWLKEGVRHRPWIIKPNLSELHGLLGRRTRSLGDLLSAADQVRSWGVGRVLISMGDRGCLLVSPTGRWLAPALPTGGGPLSPIGCGDALFGAFLTAVVRGDAEPRALAWGVAAATANLAHPGACHMGATEVRTLFPKVKIKRV